MSLFDNNPETPKLPKEKRLKVIVGKRLCPDPNCKLKNHPDLLREKIEVTRKYLKAPVVYVTTPCRCDDWPFAHIHPRETQ